MGARRDAAVRQLPFALCDPLPFRPRQHLCLAVPQVASGGAAGRGGPTGALAAADTGGAKKRFIFIYVWCHLRKHGRFSLQVEHSRWVQQQEQQHEEHEDELRRQQQQQQQQHMQSLGRRQRRWELHQDREQEVSTLPSPCVCTAFVAEAVPLLAVLTQECR